MFLFLVFFLFFVIVAPVCFIVVSLTYNIILVSGVQHNDLILYILQNDHDSKSS